MSEFETLLVGGSQEASEEGSHHILDSLGVKPLVLEELQRDVAPWRDREAYRRIKRLIPAAQLIYCEDTAWLLRHGHALFGWLRLRGLPAAVRRRRR